MRNIYHLQDDSPWMNAVKEILKVPSDGRHQITIMGGHCRHIRSGVLLMCKVNVTI